MIEQGAGDGGTGPESTTAELPDGMELVASEELAELRSRAPAAAEKGGRQLRGREAVAALLGMPVLPTAEAEERRGWYHVRTDAGVRRTETVFGTRSEAEVCLQRCRSRERHRELSLDWRPV